MVETQTDATGCIFKKSLSQPAIKCPKLQCSQLLVDSPERVRWF